MSKETIKLAHEASYSTENQHGSMNNDMDLQSILNTMTNIDDKDQLPQTYQRAKRPRDMDSHKIPKPVATNEDSFKIGDLVFVHTIKKRGIIETLENKQGEYVVRVHKASILVHKKRLSIYIDKQHLYPDNYDYDIVLKSKSYRKKNKIMNKRYDPDIKIIDGD